MDPHEAFQVVARLADPLYRRRLKIRSVSALTLFSSLDMVRTVST